MAERSIDITTSKYFSSGVPAWRSIASPATHPNSIPTNSSGPRRNVIWQTRTTTASCPSRCTSCGRFSASADRKSCFAHASTQPICRGPSRLGEVLFSATAKAGGFRDTVVLDRAVSTARQQDRGTRDLREHDASTVVHQGWMVTVDEHGNLVLRP